jgi:hypothetical protein
MFRGWFAGLKEVAGLGLGILFYLSFIFIAILVVDSFKAPFH